MRKIYIIPLIAILCVIILLIMNPIPQNENYHHFADNRKVCKIPNFLNVVTNLPFFLVGIMGLKNVSKINDQKLRKMFYTIFCGFLILTFGSGYYHWQPNNLTLVFDRLPIVVILMSFFAFIIYTTINRRTGYLTLVAFNIVGIFSVLYWAVSESIGKGDLRWYGMVQFFPIIAIPLILVLYRASLSTWRKIIFIFFFFGVAKLAEAFDRQVYYQLDETVSGHSLKHLFMAVAGFKIVRVADNYSKSETSYFSTLS